MWKRRRESNPHFEAYETSKVAVPSLRSIGGPGGNRTLISWLQATDPSVERRARLEWSLRVDSNHHRTGQGPGMLRLTLRRAMERMAGFEPAPQGLEGPAGNRYPTFALDRPTGIAPVPPRWQRGM